ncbi:hypothetical protein NE237_023743 [Protea cynaroides]|uniref:Uncharacterized protein n=1 Tax=Protea cynaroides TaxID=273540 RepID=A0A9Q0HHK5_9MAGN|nr:hypothetical protein NE237_023743 [Protea cynaroides]
MYIIIKGVFVQIWRQWITYLSIASIRESTKLRKLLSQAYMESQESPVEDNEKLLIWKARKALWRIMKNCSPQGFMLGWSCIWNGFMALLLLHENHTLLLIYISESDWCWCNGKRKMVASPKIATALPLISSMIMLCTTQAQATVPSPSPLHQQQTHLQEQVQDL